jgi:ABC-type transport system involved in cytochrome c biogenesis permease subunit
MEGGLYLFLVPASGVTCLVGIASWVFKDWKRLGRAGEWLGIGCFALTLLTWVLRWRSAGHIPIFGTYESALSLAVAVLATAFVIRHRAVWPTACGVSAALLAHGSRFNATALPLTISERSWIVDIHGILAWAAFGCLAANAGLALACLLGGERSSEATRRLLTLTLSVGFLLHSAMLASGSFYKFLLFGDAWSFDPMETLGFAAWIAYGTLLHLHLMAGVLLVVSYRIIVYFPAWSTYHILDLDLRIHINPSEAIPPRGGR